MEHFLEFQLTQKKGGKEKQRNKKPKNLMKNKQQDGRLKTSHVNNYIKCKWTKYPVKKIEIVVLKKKQDSNYFIHTYAEYRQ